ncbi:hypothetical protein TYRP_012291 [Tyrophagus putrescentiae]|nr:hypothetical protein TYRP_012291 [Tyrophagus putrescentiae]
MPNKKQLCFNSIQHGMTPYGINSAEQVTVYSATTSSPDMGYRQMVTRNTTDGLDLTIKLSGVGISKGSPYLHAAPKKSVAIHIHDGNKPCLYCLQGHHN